MSTDALLAKVRDHQPTKRGTKKVFERPERNHFMQGLVLAFDQTLSKTGWSLVDHSAMGLIVERCGVIEFPPAHPEMDGLTGFEGTLRKDWLMSDAIDWVILSQVIDRGLDNALTAIVHEMPAAKGMRIESSLMGAAAVRRSARNHGVGPVRMINRQSAYATIVGQKGAKKAEGKAAVERLIHSRPDGRWTQDVTDSVVLALKHLYLEPHQR